VVSFLGHPKISISGPPYPPVPELDISILRKTQNDLWCIWSTNLSRLPQKHPLPSPTQWTQSPGQVAGQHRLSDYLGMDAKSRKSKAQELWTNVATRLTLKLDKRVTTTYPETAAWDLNKTAFWNTPCEGPGLRTQFAVLEEALDQQAVTHQNAAAPFRPERSKASQETLEPQQEPSIPPWSLIVNHGQ
jgi:hypothetical protein